MKLYVGNLPFRTTEAAIRSLFEQHGPVQEVAIIQDRETGRSRGFAFVTMSTAEGGQAAIQALHGKAFEGRNLIINEARPREDRSSRPGPGGPPRQRR
ncbi:MAG: RNA-binding protein [Terrimicrobiaceae bacterium]|nr:RNA-binding protein [Terrimicrobiaceae bacterium]